MIACWQWAFVLGEAPWAPITVRFMRSSTRSTPRLAAHADLTANVDFVYLVEALAGFGAICSSLQFNLRSTWWNKKATTQASSRSAVFLHMGISHGRRCANGSTLRAWGFTQLVSLEKVAARHVYWDEHRAQ
jgi:hypothetical protein